MYHIRRCFGKLNKRQQEEIGTLKSPTKPLYLAKQMGKELKLKKQDIEEQVSVRYALEEEIGEVEKQIAEEEEKLKILKEMVKTIDETKLEEEKIKIHIKAKEELEREKQELEEGLSQVKTEVEKEKIGHLIYCIPVLFIVVSAILLFTQLQTIAFAGIAFALVSLISILIKNSKANKKYEDEVEEKAKQRKDIQSKIEIIEKEIKTKKETIDMAKNTLELNKKLRLEQIQLEYPNLKKLDLQNIEDKESVFEEQNYINSLKLDLSQKNIRREQILEKLEDLAKLEEKLSANEEILKELISYDEAINIAKEALDTAYAEMKERVTPKFTENLSSSVNKITDGKYKKVKVNEGSGLLLEMANRKLCKSKCAKQTE